MPSHYFDKGDYMVKLNTSGLIPGIYNVVTLNPQMI